jgi:hypothetical protein
MNSGIRSGKKVNLNELDYRKKLVGSISLQSEELRL